MNESSSDDEAPPFLRVTHVLPFSLAGDDQEPCMYLQAEMLRSRGLKSGDLVPISMHIGTSKKDTVLVKAKAINFLRGSERALLSCECMADTAINMSAFLGLGTGYSLDVDIALQIVGAPIKVASLPVSRAVKVEFLPESSVCMGIPSVLPSVRPPLPRECYRWLATFMSGSVVHTGRVFGVDWMNCPAAIRIVSVECDLDRRGFAVIDEVTEICGADMSLEGSQEVVSNPKIGVPLKDTWVEDVSRIVVGLRTPVVEAVSSVHAMLLENQPAGGCGLVISGFPGTGKTYLACAICKAANISTQLVHGADIFKATLSETRQFLSDVFAQAVRTAPSIVVLDELDAIASVGAQSMVELQVLAQLCVEMDQLVVGQRRVAVIGITSRVREVPAILRESTRFCNFVEIPVPTAHQRAVLLSHFSRKMPLNEEAVGELNALSHKMHGFVPADILRVCQQALMSAMTRVQGECTLNITLADMEGYCDVVAPSVLAGIRTTERRGEELSLGDMYGMDPTIRQARAAVLLPLANPQAYTRLGVSTPSGVFLYGPPGVGKTTLAKALAAEAHANVIVVNGTDLVSRVVGVSEKAVASLFLQARAASPCLLVIDQIDMMTPRHMEQTTQQGTFMRIVSMISTEMDALRRDKVPVIVLGTGRDMRAVHSSLLRPGRLEIHISIPLPTLHARTEILTALMARIPVHFTRTVPQLAADMQGASPADLIGMVRDKALDEIRENLKNM